MTLASPPKISIVMCVYNRKEFLSSAVSSILTQTLRDFELILWDDGSTDGATDLARDLARTDSRIRFTAGPHQGEVQAHRSAIAQVRGEYQGWVDADDKLAPTALEGTAAILDARPSIGMVYTDHWVIDQREVNKGISKRTQGAYSKDRLLVDFLTFHFRLFRTAVFNEAGGIPDMATTYDYDFCLRMSEVTEIHHLNRPMYYYRVHDKSISIGRRLEQIRWSKESIERAMQRRGMADNHVLDVELMGIFTLRRKPARTLDATP